MKFTSESKFFLGIIAGTFLIVLLAVILLSRPAKPIEKNKLVTPEAHTIGNKDANVWLVEFSDFQCPSCHAFAHTVTELANTHKDTLSVAYRHFPLPQHPYAVKAAIAAESGGRQGKFWEMGQLLFDNQDNLSDSVVASLAASLSLNMEKFSSDSADPSIKALIDADTRCSEQLGLTATPTFFLNGVKLDVGTPGELKKKVEEAINRNVQ